MNGDETQSEDITMNDRISQGIGVGGNASVGVNGQVDIGPRGRINQHFHVECFGKDGKLKWEDHFDNLVVNVGLDEYLDRIYNSAAFTSADFVGLTDGTPTFAAGDTMSSHAGWVEEIEYQATEGSPAASVRPAYVPAAAASQSLSNTASKAVFVITVARTIGGAFLTDNSSKGGTSGILLGGNVFTGGDRSLSTDDTLNVTVTASMTSS